MYTACPSMTTSATASEGSIPVAAECATVDVGSVMNTATKATAAADLERDSNLSRLRGGCCVCTGLEAIGTNLHSDLYREGWCANEVSGDIIMSVLCCPCKTLSGCCCC